MTDGVKSYATPHLMNNHMIWYFSNMMWKFSWTTSWRQGKWRGNSKSTILLFRFLRMQILWQYQHMASNNFSLKFWNIHLLYTHTDTSKTVSEFAWVALVVTNAKQTAWVTTNYCWCQALFHVHSIIGTSERLVLQFVVWNAATLLCTLQTNSPHFSWSWLVLRIPCYFELVNAADDYAMASTATSDALAQVRNLIVILETWRITGRKKGLMGKQVSKKCTFHIEIKFLGNWQADNSGKQSVYRNWIAWCSWQRTNGSPSRTSIRRGCAWKQLAWNWRAMPARLWPKSF